MSKARRLIRSYQFKYCSSVRRIITFSNCVSFTVCLVIIILVITIQELEEEDEYSTSKLDEFQAATYIKPVYPVTSRPSPTTKLQIVQNTKHDLSLRNRTTEFTNVVKSTENYADDLPPIKPPKKSLPIIKVKYNLRYSHIKLLKKTTEGKLISPKKLKYRDVFNALAHPKIFREEGTEPTFKEPEHRIRIGMNDWILANSPRDKNKFLVYSAYWDDRFDLMNNVRIMAVLVTKNPPPVFCRLQMADGNVMDVPVARKIMNEHWRLKYASYFLSCELPKNIPPPLKVLVSLQRNFTYSALLPVYQNKENIASPRGDLAVCVKPFHYYYDRATWLVEFIELHRVLGVEHFFFYNHTVGPNVEALLRHYTQQNVVTVLPWNLPIRSQKEIRTEGIFSSLNDCVFRTMYLFHYVIMLDFDEYIIPREHDTYLEMLQQLEEDNKRIRGKPGSFVFRNTFFYLYWENDTTVYGQEPEKPPQWMPYFVTQYKTRRLSTSMKTGSRSKYIVVPERVIEVGNHVVWRHTSGSRAIQVADTVALLHHYRICEFGGFSCLKKPSLVDRTATRFGTELLRRTLHQCRLVYPELKGRCPLSPPLGSPW